MYRSLLPFLRLWQTPVSAPAERLQLLLEDVFVTEFVRHEGNVIMLFGHLRQDAEDVFPLIRHRCEREGYTPMLRRLQGRDVVILAPGVVQPKPVNPTLNVLLFLATLGTTVWAGSFLSHPPTSAWEWLSPVRLLSGLPFAIALLSILGIHELGHYFMARHHGVDVTPPYFIPVPFGLGTFGAFIQLRSPVEDRKALFDVGLAGPVAGFIVALPFLTLGLTLPASNVSGIQLSHLPLLMRWAAALLRPGTVTGIHPIAFAAYIGLWVTAMHLLPIGQLDGGHVAYGMFGARFRYVAWAMFVSMIFLGLTLWEGWFFWAAFVGLVGVNHPPPLNDITPLDRKRQVVFVLAVLLFIITFVPRPF